MPSSFCQPRPGIGSGLARALSKLGFCSRSQARILIAAGRVTVNQQVRRDPEFGVDLRHDQIAVNADVVRPAAKVYLMLNKPRGLMVTASDERGRETVFKCLDKAHVPHLSAVGRLDKASEGLLLFTNDTHWAARITDPAGHVEKTYHVQVDRLVDPSVIGRLTIGIQVSDDFLAAKRARLLRQGTRNCWLEIVLAEGRNRHIRRLLEALDIRVLRLVRVAIGPLQLGNLAKGQYRFLSQGEQEAFREKRSSRFIERAEKMP